MQIFLLNRDLARAAQELHDRDFLRFNKQILELGQLVSTAARRRFALFEGRADGAKVYREAYVHHPLTMWLCGADDRFWWALEYLRCLLDVFERERHKKHATAAVYAELARFRPDGECADALAAVEPFNLTPYHDAEDVCGAYSRYLEDKHAADRARGRRVTGRAGSYSPGRAE